MTKPSLFSTRAQFIQASAHKITINTNQRLNTKQPDELNLEGIARNRRNKRLNETPKPRRSRNPTYLLTATDQKMTLSVPINSPSKQGEENPTLEA